MIECVEKEPVIIAVYDGFWGSQGYLLPVDSFVITSHLSTRVDAAGKGERGARTIQDFEAIRCGLGVSD